MEGFADLLDRLLKAAWGNDWGTFTDEFPTGTDPEKLPLPILTWEVARRAPSEAMKQLKQRNWGSQPDPDHPGDFFAVYHQWFDCRVEFTAYCRTTREAKLLIRKLEELLLTFAGHFKEQGISEMLFAEEKRGQLRAVGRQELASRMLCYNIRIQQSTAARTFALREIFAKAELAKVDPSPSINVPI